MAFLQPSYIVDRRIGSGFDAAVIAIDGLMLGNLGVAKAIGLLLGSEQLDIFTQRALIAFERENVIGLLIEDFLGDVALAAHGVDGDDGAFDHQHVEKCRDGADLVGFVRHFDLAEHERRWRAAKADTIWIAALPRFLWAEPRNVLPSKAITSADTPISLATQATKRRWNCVASRLAKMSPRWSCDGVPSWNGRNRANDRHFLCAKP